MAMFLSESYALDSMRSGCIYCANGTPRKRSDGVERILTTDFGDEMAGIPEICETCLEEAASLFGMITGRRHAQAVDDLSKAAFLLVEMADELDDKNATIRVLTKELERANAAAESVAQ